MPKKNRKAQGKAKAAKKQEMRKAKKAGIPFAKKKK